MKKLTKKTLVSFVLTLCITLATWANITQPPKTNLNASNQFIEQVDTIKVDTIKVDTIKVDTIKVDNTRTKFIQEIDNYIRHNYPNSKLNGKYIANACLEHEFDPCFLLAQGVIESGLGTAGKAKRTGSPWNVGQHDGRSVHEMNRLGLTHNDPNNAIEPYIILVKTKYLGAKRTYGDLMRNYVTLSGHRYASNRSYERSLRSMYERIKSKTSIYDLYVQLIGA